jgi:hypothetical protein
METAVGLMESFDGVVRWNRWKVEGEGQRSEVEDEKKKEESGRWDELLVLVTSDHGNMEDLSTRKHTDADVPLIVLGSKSAREEFSRGMTDLTPRRAGGLEDGGTTK